MGKCISDNRLLLNLKTALRKVAVSKGILHNKLMFIRAILYSIYEFILTEYFPQLRLFLVQLSFYSIILSDLTQILVTDGITNTKKIDELLILSRFRILKCLSIFLLRACARANTYD